MNNNNKFSHFFKPSMFDFCLCSSCDLRNVPPSSPRLLYCIDCTMSLRRLYLTDRICRARGLFSIELQKFLATFLYETLVYQRHQQSYFLKKVLLSEGSAFRQFSYEHSGGCRLRKINEYEDILTRILRFSCKSYRNYEPPFTFRRWATTNKFGYIVELRYWYDDE